MIASVRHPHWAQVLAATVRYTQNLELADAAVEEVFARTIAGQSIQTLTARSRATALNLLRRDLTYVSDLPLLVIPEEEAREFRRDAVRDDRRTLAYLLCHPALPMETRIALMLRMMAGASIRDVAERLNEPEKAVAARLADASRQMRTNGIPFETPDDAQFAERVHPVLAMIATGQDECEPWCAAAKPWADSTNEKVLAGSAV